MPVSLVAGYDKLAFLMIISGRTQKDNIVRDLAELGIHLVNSFYGKGTVSASYLQSMLGLAPEENKALLTCLSSIEKIDSALEMLQKKHKFNQPNTGIAFVINVGGLAYN